MVGGGEARWRRWHSSSCSAFFMQQDTRQWPERLHIKDQAKGKSACGNMREEGRIDKQSREQRGSGWAWRGYHILYLNTCNRGLPYVMERLWDTVCFYSWHEKNHTELHFTYCKWSLICHKQDTRRSGPKIKTLFQFITIQCLEFRGIIFSIVYNLFKLRIVLFLSLEN